MRTKTMYLYGTEKVPKIPGKIIQRRIHLLQANLENLLSVHYSLRDEKRISSILKAVKFWENINKN